VSLNAPIELKIQQEGIQWGIKTRVRREREGQPSEEKLYSFTEDVLPAYKGPANKESSFLTKKGWSLRVQRKTGPFKGAKKKQKPLWILLSISVI